MKPSTVVRALLFVAMTFTVWGAANAADRAGMRPGYDRGATGLLPFPRRARAEAVWAEGACWRDCQSICTWGFAQCLKMDAQGHCLAYTDACDRRCQRECRAHGGPLLSIGD